MLIYLIVFLLGSDAKTDKNVQSVKAKKVRQTKKTPPSALKDDKPKKEDEQIPFIAPIRKVNVGSVGEFSPNLYRRKKEKIPRLVLRPELIPAKAIQRTQFKPRAKLVPAKLDIIAQAPLLQVPKFAVLSTEKLDNSKPLPVKEYSPEEELFLQAMIYYKIHKNYPLSFALFDQLKRDDSLNYYKASSARKIGMMREARKVLEGVIDQKKSRHMRQALLDLIDIVDIEDRNLVEKLWKKRGFIAESERLTFLRSYQLYLDKKYKTSLKLAKNYHSPRFKVLQALNEFQLKDPDQAVTALEGNIDQIKNERFKSFSRVTLARIYMHSKKYARASHHYIRVSPQSPLWLDSLVERGWAQLLLKDYPGAIGNMHSLQVDMFKDTLLVDTYLIRTIGYLNLCQYGDAINMIHQISGEYGDHIKALNELKSQSIYQLARDFLKDKKGAVPTPLILEMIRHPRFISFQKTMNQIEDEKSSHKKALKLLEENENQLAADIKKWIAKEKTLAKTKLESYTEQEKEEHLDRQFRLIGKIQAFQDFLAAMKIARERLSVKTGPRIEQLNAEKSTIVKKSDRFLQVQRAQLIEVLQTQIDEAEILKFEIYDGAGEHLRLKLSGAKPQKGKYKVRKKDSHNWKFSGEIWQDEIGNYRSNLENMCPKQLSYRGEE